MTGRTKSLVERFYYEMWNRADETVGRDIIDDAFRFRGSLGPALSGRAAFFRYMRTVHAALGEYTCTIEELVVAGDRAAARMTFRGLHRAPLFGVAATGREICWDGAAFFRMKAGRIGELWVLGDVAGIKAQLGAAPSARLQIDQDP